MEIIFVEEKVEILVNIPEVRRLDHDKAEHDTDCAGSMRRIFRGSKHKR